MGSSIQITALYFDILGLKTSPTPHTTTTHHQNTKKLDQFFANGENNQNAVKSEPITC